jgi:hypothetical protein
MIPTESTLTAPCPAPLSPGRVGLRVLLHRRLGLLNEWSFLLWRTWPAVARAMRCRDAEMTKDHGTAPAVGCSFAGLFDL